MTELRLDPDRLRAHARVAAELADELRAAGRSVPAGRPETERLRDAVLRAAGRIGELGGVLSDTAAAAAAGDRAAAAELRRIPSPPAGGRT